MLGYAHRSQPTMILHSIKFCIICSVCNFMRSVKSRGSVGDEALNWPYLMLLCLFPSISLVKSCLLVVPSSLVVLVFGLVFSMCLIRSNVDRWLKNGVERNTAQVHNSVRFIEYFLHGSGAVWAPRPLLRWWSTGVLTEGRRATFGISG